MGGRSHRKPLGKNRGGALNFLHELERLTFAGREDHPIAAVLDRVSDDLERRCERAADLRDFEPDLETRRVAHPAKLVREQKIERRDAEWFRHDQSFLVAVARLRRAVAAIRAGSLLSIRRDVDLRGDDGRRLVTVDFGLCAFRKK